MDINYDIYCLSYNNVKRKTQMENRFQELNLKCTFHKGSSVNIDDQIVINRKNIASWSCMLGHLDMIKHFYENSEKEYGIFCEDDIYIHKDFKLLLPNIIEDFKLMNLDVLLLGYLIQFKIESKHIMFNLKSHSNDLKYTYYNYPDDLWGAQMYMLTKKHAKYILDKYTIYYPIRTFTDNTLVPFSSDWTITKEGNRALIYPMLAVEIADKISGHQGQDTFHENCKNFNYNPDIYI